jgi:hypothetical protein
MSSHADVDHSLHYSHNICINQWIMTTTTATLSKASRFFVRFYLLINSYGSYIERNCWPLGLWCRMDKKVVTNVSEKHSVTIYSPEDLPRYLDDITIDKTNIDFVSAQRTSAVT